MSKKLEKAVAAVQALSVSELRELAGQIDPLILQIIRGMDRE